MITAVFGDALLDPAKGETAREAVVVIEDGRVTRAGRRDGTQVPRDAERIDAEGLTLLPGLIDCHVHLTNLGEGLDFARELTTPPTLELMRAVRAARRTLDAGFTSVRDAAGTPAGVRMAIDGPENSYCTRNYIDLTSPRFRRWVGSGCRRVPV